VLQGGKSTADERGVAALKAVDVDDSLNGAAKQVDSTANLSRNSFVVCWFDCGIRVKGMSSHTMDLVVCVNFASPLSWV